MRIPTLILLALLLAALAAAASGCGASRATDGAPAPTAPHTTAPVSLGAPTAPDVERLLGNAFRRGLRTLAVMAQPGDDAADLGQALPTGLLDGLRCRAAAAGHWTCRARWTTVDGRRRTTAYRVQTTTRGCVYAQATPALRQVYDATTHAPAEHPLGALVGTVPGC
jgi:hypothetical protein